MENKKRENPLLLTHMQVLRGVMITTCAWPTEVFGERSRRRIYSIFFSLATGTLSMGEIAYLAKKFNQLTFFDLGDMYLTLFLTLLTFIRSFVPRMKNYGGVINDFITKFHLVHFKHKGEYYDKICRKMIKLSHYFSLTMVFMMFSAVVFFNYLSTYNNYVNKAFSNEKEENYNLQYSIYYIYPGFNQDDHFALSICVNVYLCYVCAILVVGIDTFMNLMAFQIIGHIQILLHNIHHLAKPKHPIAAEVVCLKTYKKTKLSIEMYDIDENRIIRKKVIQFVEHHKLIISFAGSVSQFFGPMLALNYLYHLVSCAILLLECMNGEPAALARYIPITVITYCQLIQVSVTFEIIRSESEKLKDEVYNIPWECMDISNQHLVRMFLNNIQIPIRVTALGMAEVGVQAMVAILKTTFSYLTLLQSLNE